MNYRQKLKLVFESHGLESHQEWDPNKSLSSHSRFQPADLYDYIYEYWGQSVASQIVMDIAQDFGVELHNSSDPNDINMFIDSAYEHILNALLQAGIDPRQDEL